MGEIAERALREGAGDDGQAGASIKEVQAQIDLDEVRTAYSNGGTEHEAIQIPWATVRAILGHDHTGDPDEDRQLVEALIAAGAPGGYVTRRAAGSMSTAGGLIGPEFAGRARTTDVPRPKHHLIKAGRRYPEAWRLIQVACVGLAPPLHHHSIMEQRAAGYRVRPPSGRLSGHAPILRIAPETRPPS